jgi:hypothetical protein
MYELKKIGEVFTSKFVGTGRGPSLKKMDLPDHGLTNVEKHWCSGVKSRECVIILRLARPVLCQDNNYVITVDTTMYVFIGATCSALLIGHNQAKHFCIIRKRNT